MTPNPRLASLPLLAVLLSLPALAAPSPVIVTSPDGKIRAELAVTGGTLTYTVTADGKPILEPSRLGIQTNGADLGEDVTLGAPRTHKVDETYRFFGAHPTATDRANEAVVPATSHGESYFVDLHVADDGVGVRLRLSAKPGRTVQADHSAWKLPGDPTVWLAKLDKSYEAPYHASTLHAIGPDLFGFPLTARVGDLYVTLTEAALKDYGDLSFKLDADGSLVGELHADPNGWTTDAAVTQPWRVTVIARDLTALVNTTLVQNLNPPASPELARAAWIKPGRSSWQWLATGDPVESEQKQWVDWTAQIGFEYYLIDEGWEKWPDSWQAVGKTAAYAKSKNVNTWIWVHSKFVWTPAERQEFFKKTVAAGVVGVKIDFPPATSREVANWYVDTARDAAAVHLMVDFHGANKPTGLNRTWPNIMTREGVRGHEWEITRYKRRLDDDHDVILPFTRYIAGPGDYTPTVFTPSELMGNTWGHELAQAIVFTSPFLCFGGHPQSYLENPAKDVLTAIPPVWDETRILPGSEPGKIDIEARRRGNQWFLAVLNGSDATSVDVPLSFLAPGPWKSVQLRDRAGKPDAWDRKEASVTSADHLKIDLTQRGGFVGWLRK